MHKKTAMIYAATAVAAGIAIYLIARKKKLTAKNKSSAEKDIPANVFTYSRRHGGSEFVL